MPADFQWLRPEWLFGIPLLLLVVVVLARGKLGSGNWASVIDPALMPYVLSRDPGRGSDQRWWLLGLGGVIALTALAGPAWQRVEQPVFRTEQAMVIALDLSRSMDAQDLSPSRLRRAKLKILDMLNRRSAGQTALIVYSANAFTVTPLTTDTDTIASLTNSLSTDIMPSRGSFPEVAIGKGLKLLQQANAAVGEVLLVTDGGSSPAASEAARELLAAGYTLSVLGIGTTEGAPIPKTSGGFVTDNRGQIAVPRLEERALRGLAAIGGGRYARVSADDRDLNALLAQGAAGVRPIEGNEAVATDTWREEGPWLLLLLLPIAALAFRRGWVLVAVIVIAPFPQPARAALAGEGLLGDFQFRDLWLNKNQQAQQALESGDASEAAALFENEEWQGVADYRAGDFAGSAQAFAETEDTRNLYNLGNAKAQQGELEAAIEAYERALELDPNDEDAAYNLELVKDLKDEQDQQQQNEGDDQQSSENSGGDGDQSESDQQSDQQGEEGESQSEGDESETRDSGDQEMTEEDMKALQEELQRAAEEAKPGDKPEQMSDAELAELREQQEQQQAMEQWLRRVPDDPGGLLRRKFRYQYQRTGKDQDGNDVWPDNEVQPW